MIILVTGSSGFTGELLMKKLRQEKIDCIGIDILPGLYTDIVQDITIPFEINKKIGIIIHLAAKLEHHRSTKKEFFRTNVIGTENLLKLAQKNNSYFIYVSTIAVYGFQKCPISEKTPLNPIGNYAITKLQGEDLCRKYHSENLKISIVRPTVLIGKKRLGIYQTIFKKLSNNSLIPIVGNGNTKISFASVDDLVDFLYFLIKNPKDDLVVNFGGMVPGSLLEIINEFKIYLNSSSKIFKIPSILTPFLKILSYLKLIPITPWQLTILNKDFYFDNSELYSLNFNYSHDVLSTLKSMIENYGLNKN